MAEVLIVLGIIGLIADMTIPTLVNDFQKKVYVTKLQHHFSAISQAVKMSEIDNGPPNQWILGDFEGGYTRANLKRVADQYLVPYFKKSEVWERTSSFADESYGMTIADGTIYAFALDGAFLENQAPGVIRINIHFGVKGKTGNLASSDRDYSRKDFVINVKSKGATFFDWCNKNRACMINHNLYGCRKEIAKNKRLMCPALIQLDGWKISNDYPW